MLGAMALVATAGSTLAFLGASYSQLGAGPVLSHRRSAGQGLKNAIDEVSALDVFCGKQQEDVAFWTPEPLHAFEGIPTAEECMELCEIVPKCYSWTWRHSSAEKPLAPATTTQQEEENVEAKHARTSRRSSCGLQQKSLEWKLFTDFGVVSGIACHLGRLPPNSPHSSTTSPLEEVARHQLRASTTTSALATRASTPQMQTLGGGGAPSAKTTTTKTTIPDPDDHHDASQARAHLEAQTAAATATGATGAPTLGPPVKNANSSEVPASPTAVTSSDHQSARNPLVGLFCWLLMLPYGYEPQLVASLYNKQVSIFACDRYAVYSNRTLQVTPTLATRKIEIDLQCDYGGEFRTALNSDIFRAVWRQVADDGDYLSYTWTVKVDADTVFLPGRLSNVLSRWGESEAPGSGGIYFANCKFGLHGPIEVLSRAAVQAWAWGSDLCAQHFTKLCDGDCYWGEDMFLDQCLKRVLGVRRENLFTLLTEEHCDPPADWRKCQLPHQVGFHPFKGVRSWFECYEAAREVDLANRMAQEVRLLQNWG